MIKSIKKTFSNFAKKKSYNAPAVAEGALSFTLVHQYASQNWFPFSNLSLPQPYIVRYETYTQCSLHCTTKHRSSLNFDGITLTVLELHVSPFINGKVMNFLVSVL